MPETSTTPPPTEADIPAELARLLTEARDVLVQIQARAEEAKSAATAAAETAELVVKTRTDAEEKLAQIAGVASQAAAAKGKIADDQVVIDGKAKHIQDAQVHADEVRAELDRTLTAAKQQATDAEGLKARTQAAADAAAELQTAVRNSKGSADTDIAAIATSKSTATETADDLKDLLARAERAEAKVSAYETDLLSLKTKSEEQLAEIVRLLPGATSAGLASAFDERRKTFIKPGIRWQWLFVGSVAALVALAAWGLWQVYVAGATASYDSLWRVWLARLPVAGALVWLAVHAGRESALAKRLEEDYGYKAAIAASFQGFHKQMSDLDIKAGLDTPLLKLCDDTLATIANPPGRIYDKHRLTSTPAHELKDLVRTIAAKSDGQKPPT